MQARDRLYSQEREDSVQTSISEFTQERLNKQLKQRGMLTSSNETKVDELIELVQQEQLYFNEQADNTSMSQLERIDDMQTQWKSQWEAQKRDHQESIKKNQVLIDQQDQLQIHQ